ncbi:nicotinate-nucleotide--dimethylbenzimidazole phosphoribosyltransferase [Nakamurella sp. YIM 132087]|uniref:Nicotinate-nucleotide--dimethylbenzimidazole phosphoribosyltransferase n=1 Tax=Nakamurella alba TaxID=2665158 RepID=A0A7K1FG42_9ACTN|nr:nicotinate-nucleotide--dimethylbenzimidazole phosphoribosyltransferase [Nakamurella alba]MTD13072.1 nicotinate-nucleotide--dimethylbenzimidazole phosphoribosyltransferase [Nakamurella alba]
MSGAVAREAVAAPSREVAAAARTRLDALATPLGAWGRLGELAVWYAACSGSARPTGPERVRVVVLAGDHGVAQHGVSAYPAAVTPAMVRTVLAGGAGVAVLGRSLGATVRVLDIAVDDDLAGVPADVQRYKVRRSSGSIDREDACSAAEIAAALAAGAEIAAEEIDAGADLLVLGDLGIGNTTPAAVLIGAQLGLDAATVTGRGTGIDDPGLERKTEVIGAALARVRGRAADPVDLLAAAGGADFAAGVGFLAAAARHGVPVLLDGVIAVAQALTAQRLQPGAVHWWAAGHRSTEPAQSAALQALGLEPLLDLGMRLGEGTGALAAVPLLRSATAVLSGMSLLSDLDL